MEDDLLREAIRALLQEKGDVAVEPTRQSGPIAYYKINDPVGKLALIMPGINHPSYSTDMPKTIMEKSEGYLRRFSYIVPNGTGVSVAAALDAINRDKKVDLNTASERILIGHSAGGAAVLRYLTTSGAGPFNKIYLLDPTPTVTSLPMSDCSNVLLIHNWRNWSSGQERRKAFNLLGKDIAKKGGVAEENIMNHMAILDEGLTRAAMGVLAV
jgi:hypothetical protein